MSRAHELRIIALEGRVTELEETLERILKAFPEGYRGKHLGMRRYYVIDRFGERVSTSRGLDPFDTLEEADAEATEMNARLAA